MGRADAEVNVRVTGEDAGGKRVLKEVDDTAEEARRSVDRLGDATGLEELDREAAEAVLELRRLVTAFEQADRALVKADLDGELDKAGKEAQKLRRDVVAAGKAVANFGGKNAGLANTEKAFKKVQGATKRARRELEKFQKKSSGGGFSGAIRGITSLRTAVGALQLAFGVAIAERFLSSLIRVSAESVKLSAALQKVTPALKANLGGTDAAAEANEFLRRTQDELKVGLVGLSDSYVQLTAATSGTVIEGETTERLFLSITKAGRALGKSNEDIGRAFLGLSQAAGGANVQMQEVRQITEAIPGLFAAWAKELGKTQGELRQLIKDTKVTADELGVLADAADRLEGGALAEQLKTIAGQMQAFEVAAEKAKIQLAEGLEPGLLALIKVTLEEEKALGVLSKTLGEFIGGELAEVAAGFEFASLAIRKYIENLEAAGLEDVVKIIGLDRLRDDLEGVPEAAREAFGALVKEALNAAGAVEEGSKSIEIVVDTFGKIPEAAKKAYREATKEAGIDAKSQVKIAQDLAADVVEITERSVKEREILGQILVGAAREGGKVEVEAREFVARRIKELTEEAIADARRLTQVRIDEAEKVAAAERKLTEDRKKEFAEQFEAAREFVEERIKTETEASRDLAKLEEQLTEKRLELEEDYVAAFALEEEKRAEALAEVEKKIVALAEEGIEKRKKLAESLLEQEKKIAEERIALEKQLQDQFAELRDIAKPPEEKVDDQGRPVDDEGGGDGLDRTREKLNLIGQSLNEISATLGAISTISQGPLNPEAILETAFAFARTSARAVEYGQVVQEIAVIDTQASTERIERANALLEKIAEQVEAIEGQSATQQIYSDILQKTAERVALLAEAEAVAEEDIAALLETYELWIGETAPDAIESIDSLTESLAKQQEEQTKTTEGVEAETKARETQVEVVENADGSFTVLQKTKENLAETEEKSVKPTEDAAEAIREAGEVAVQAAGPTGELADEVGNLAEEAPRAGAGVDELATAAEGLSQVEPPDAIADAIAKIASNADRAATSTRRAAEGVQNLVDKTEDMQALKDVVESTADAMGRLADEAGRAADETSRLAAAQSQLDAGG